MVDYQPLIGNQIRLLTLQPGAPEDDIQCSVTTVSLDNRPKYEAISYVWGDPTDTRDIFVQVFSKTDIVSRAFRRLHLRDRLGRGASLAVTKNLFAALRRFRRYDKARIFWVDAVCINQQDLSERSNQVLLMGRIFSHCEACQVWLGEVDDVPLPSDPEFSSKKGYYERDLDVSVASYASMRAHIETENIRHVEPIDNCELRKSGNLLSIPGALAMLRLLAEDKDKHFNTLPFYRITEFPDFELCEQWHNAYRSLVNICFREWWGRTWVVQEAILPQQTFVNIGCHRVELDLFLRTSHSIEIHANSYLACCKKNTLWQQYTSFSESLLYAMYRINKMKYLRDSQRVRKKTFDNTPINLHQCLAMGRLVTDPRDVVYGYYGLIPTLRPLGQKPDYAGESVASLYAKTTKKYVAVLEDLGILNSVTPLKRRKDGALLSWVVDWQGQELQYFLDVKDMNAACGKFQSYERKDLFEDPQVLPIDGLAVGTVVWTSSLFQDLDESKVTVDMVSRTLLSWQQAVDIVQTANRTMARKEKDEPSIGSPEDRDNEFRFWRTVYHGERVIVSDDREKIEGSHPYDISRFIQRDMDMVQRWWAWFQHNRLAQTAISDVDYPCPEYKECWDELYILTRDKAFCVLDVPGSTNPRLAMCMKCVKPGDVVVVAKGSDFPLVLRKVNSGNAQTTPSTSLPSSSTSSEGTDSQNDPSSSRKSQIPEYEPSMPARYNFMGLAYVDGIMEGQAVSDKTDWELMHII